MKRITPFFLLVLFSMGATSLAAQKKKSKNQSQEGQTANLQMAMTQFELQRHIDAYFLEFAGLVEEAADSIIDNTRSSEVAQQAQLWKINAIPVAQRTFLVTNPYNGLLDGVILCMQMETFFSTGNGKAVLGDFQPLAVEVSKKLIARGEAIGRMVKGEGDISQGKALLQQFADNHPIQSIYFNRESSLPVIARFQEVEKMGLGKVAKNINNTVEELTNRLNIYTEQLPKQVRWQAEYMTSSLLENPALSARMDSLTAYTQTNLDSMMGLMERVVLLTESTPHLVDTQRIAATADLRREREIVLSTLQGERRIILAAVTSEREAVIDALRAEYQVVFDDLSNERNQLMVQVDSVAQRSIETSFIKLDGLVNRIFWKVLLLFAVLIVGTGALLYLVKAAK